MTSLQGSAATDELITLAEAAEQLDVHYMTAYRYVRTGRMLAEKRAGKWWVTAADLAAVVQEGTGARRRAASDGPPRELLVKPFTARLLAGDTAGCWDLVSDALSGGASPKEVHTKLLQPSLEKVGELWHNGEISVAAEHRATATAIRLLGQMGPLFRHRGRRRGTIVLGATAGDSHSLPTAMLADLLSDMRFDVIDLGANTPTESFVEVCRELDNLVGLGVCTVLDEHVERALIQVQELRDALPDVFLVLGGSAFARTTTATVEGHVDVISTSAEHACEAFEKAAQKPVAAITTTEE